VQRLHDGQRVRIERLIAIDKLTQRGAAQRLKVRRFRRTQADFERAGMSLRDDIWCVARRCIAQCNIRIRG
jgi:hypothetical protein